MYKYVFTCELYRYHQTENYKNWNTKVVIVAENDTEAKNRFKEYEYHKIRYYLPDYKKIPLDDTEIEQARAEEQGTIYALNKPDKIALGMLLGLAGAYFGNPNIDRKTILKIMKG